MSTPVASTPILGWSVKDLVYLIITLAVVAAAIARNFLPARLIDDLDQKS